MLQTLMCLMLALPSIAREPASDDSPASIAQKPAPPDPQRVKAAVAELEKAFKEGQSAERIRAIEDGERTIDAQVIRWIAHGLADRDVEVQRAAIEALRFMDHPDALKDLETAALHDESLRKDPEIYAALLKAIGQHASPSSLPIFKESLWTVQDRAVIRARVLGIGQIRTEAAVEALIGLMRSGGKGVIQPFMEDFRLALAELTGVDQGRSQDLWYTWWNENHAKLKVDAKPPVLAKPLQRTWDSYWSRDVKDEPNTKHKSDEPDKKKQ
jgi:hypothetical protein